MIQHQIRVSILQRLTEQGKIHLQLRKLTVHVSDWLWLFLCVVPVFLLLGFVLLEVNLEDLTVEEDKKVFHFSFCIRQLNDHGIAKEELATHILDQRVDMAELKAKRVGTFFTVDAYYSFQLGSQF